MLSLLKHDVPSPSGLASTAGSDLDQVCIIEPIPSAFKRGEWYPQIDHSTMLPGTAQSVNRIVVRPAVDRRACRRAPSVRARDD